MQSKIIKSIIIIVLIVGTFVLKCQANNIKDRNASKIKKREVKQYSVRGRSGINHFPALSRYKSKRSIARARRGQSNCVNTVTLDSPSLARQVLIERRTHGASKLPKIQKKNEKRLSKIRSIHQSHIVSSRGIKSGKNLHKARSEHDIGYKEIHQLEKRSPMKHIKKRSEKNEKILTHKIDKGSKRNY